MAVSKNETGSNVSVPQLKKVAYDIPIEKHVIHVTFKRVKAYNDRINSLFALCEEQKDELEFYNAEELKEENPSLYFSDTGGMSRVFGNGYYEYTEGTYTSPLTTDELKSSVLQFIKETEICLTEENVQKIVQYAPKKKDGTLTKKRVTLLIKSKWANHDGDCTALVARNTSDTDLDIEMVDLYIGEDRFNSAEAIIAAGIMDETSRTQIASSVSEQAEGTEKNKGHTITKGHLLPGTTIPRFLEDEMEVPFGNQTIKVVFHGKWFTSHFKYEVEPILQERKTFAGYQYYDREKYDLLVEALLSEGRIYKGEPIPLDILSESLQQLNLDEILEYFERVIKDIVNCWSEEKLSEIVSSLPRKKDGTLTKNRVTRILEAPYVKVNSYDGSVILNSLEAKNISDTEVELRYY